MADEPLSIVVDEGDAGRRLDAALAELLPGAGLRGRRRACGLGRALVNGRARPAAYRTRPGDVLTLECELVEQHGPIGIGEATAWVGNERAANAELTFVIADA